VQNINIYHSRFKSWLIHFHGVATKYIPNYLEWCRMMDEYKSLTPEILLNSALGDFQSFNGDIAFLNIFKILQ